ncbi:uncharacterized protein LOC121972738 [Zingiber officinale]|uniref:uncharacterized protein LOC121972738 n=1 Tax=Zingiber officinale TaxID=94328 RepID=UPI001C4D40BD|nr:uncharacterized protein LOC121972738 [Zingiber officinale]
MSSDDDSDFSRKGVLVPTVRPRHWQSYQKWNYVNCNYYEFDKRNIKINYILISSQIQEAWSCRVRTGINLRATALQPIIPWPGRTGQCHATGSPARSNCHAPVHAGRRWQSRKYPVTPNSISYGVWASPFFSAAPYLQPQKPPTAVAHRLRSTSPAPRIVLYLSSSQSFDSRTPSFHRKTPRPAPLACRCSKKKEANFADQLLDYIEGGPKLRKWYGAPDLPPKDGDLEDEDEDESSEIEETRDAVLVTDGESEIGQFASSFIPFSQRLSEVFVRSFVHQILSYLAGWFFFSDVARTKGVNHIVLLSQLAYYKGSGGFQAIMNSKARELADRDEKVVITAGVPYTIIRTGLLQSVPSGDHAFSFSKGDAAKGNLSKEDAAVICVEALESPPEEGLIFQVANGEEKVTDWKVKFAALIEGTGVSQ